MIFSAVAWQDIGIMIAPARTGTGSQEAAKGVANKRRRLLQIAVMISLCLLLNTIAMLSTASKLEEWNRTADLSLNCHTGETWFTRNFEAYGLNREEAVNMCSAEAANGVAVQSPCRSDCYWQPSVYDLSLICAQEGSPHQSIEDLVTAVEAGENPSVCDCPCSAFVQVEKPRFSFVLCIYIGICVFHFLSFHFESVAMLVLAQVAQSLVVSIVGLNLGFRSFLQLFESFWVFHLVFFSLRLKVHFLLLPLN
jgi:hypothetical protein